MILLENAVAKTKIKLFQILFFNQFFCYVSPLIKCNQMNFGPMRKTNGIQQEILNSVTYSLERASYSSSLIFEYILLVWSSNLSSLSHDSQLKQFKSFVIAKSLLFIWVRCGTGIIASWVSYRVLNTPTPKYKSNVDLSGT